MSFLNFAIENWSERRTDKKVKYMKYELQAEMRSQRTKILKNESIKFSKGGAKNKLFKIIIRINL